MNVCAKMLQILRYIEPKSDSRGKFILTPNNYSKNMKNYMNKSTYFFRARAIHHMALRKTLSAQLNTTPKRNLIRQTSVIYFLSPV